MKGKNIFFLLITVVAVAFVVFVGGFVSESFIGSAVKKSNEYNYKLSVTEKSDYDYRVYYPLKSQIDEMKEEESIDKVFPYYNYKATLSFNNKQYETRAIFTYDESNKNISEYNENRLMKGKLSDEKNYIILDGVSAGKLGARIGDTVKIALSKTEYMDVYVAGIVETNTFYETGAVYLDYSKDVKDEIDSKYEELSLNGVLIKESDPSCLTYLKSYVPLGDMLTRDYFNTDNEYNSYVDNYMNADYSSKIYNKKVVLISLKNNNETLYKESYGAIMRGAIVMGIMLFALVIETIVAYIYLARYRKIYKTTISSKEFIFKYFVKNVLSFVVLWIVLYSNIVTLFSEYLTYDNLIDKVYLYMFVSSISVIVLVGVIDLVCLRVINNKKYV